MGCLRRCRLSGVSGDCTGSKCCFVVKTASPFAGIIAVTKIQLTLTSLIAVIPGAFLIYVLVMAMLESSDKMSTIAYVVLGTALLSMVITVLMPVGIFMGGTKRATAKKGAAKKAKKEESVSEIEALEDDIELADDVDAASLADAASFADESLIEDDSIHTGELALSGEMPLSTGDDSLHIGTEEFDLGNSYDDLDATDAESGIDTEPVEDFESFEFDDEDDDGNVMDEIEEEPKPKKKKR